MSHLKPIRPTPPTFDEEDGTKIIGALPRNLIRSIDRFQGRLIPKKKMASRLARGAVTIPTPDRFGRVAANRLYPSRYVREAVGRRELFARQTDDAIRWAKSLEESK